MSGTSPRDRWDARYSKPDGAFDCRDPRSVVVQAADLAAPGVALDLACGRGRNALYLAGRGWQVVAVDVSGVALAGISHPRISTVQADLEAGEFRIEPGAFDLIVDTFYLQRDLFEAIRMGVRAGGLFAGEIPMEDPEAAPMNPAYLLAPGEWIRLFAGWSIEAGEECRDEAHGRMTARVIARKPG